MSFLINIEDVVKHIPKEATTPLHKTLTDVILKSKNGQMLAPNLAKSILNLYHDEKLSSDEGFKVLLESAISLEKEKVTEKLKEINLNEAASLLGDN